MPQDPPERERHHVGGEGLLDLDLGRAGSSAMAWNAGR